MYAIPFVMLLAAVWADQQETPSRHPDAPPEPRQPPPDPSAFGALLNRSEMVEDYGTEPGSWSAAWHGVRYGGDPITSQIEAINSQVMKIVKQILGWSVATKGPKLISLNNQRDTLIKQGVPLHHPQISAIEQQATKILHEAGMKPQSQEDRTLRALAAQRDRLMLQQAGLA